MTDKIEYVYLVSSRLLESSSRQHIPGIGKQDILSSRPFFFDYLFWVPIDNVCDSRKALNSSIIFHYIQSQGRRRGGKIACFEFNYLSTIGH